MKYQRISGGNNLIQHQGVFRKQIPLLEGTALIVSGTIGAGMLGIPYAIARVGMGLGILYIIGIGLLMMSVNLILGRITVVNGEELQLVGLAKKYLGRGGGIAMSLISYTTLLSVLTVYIIGSGQALSAIFGGSNVMWSLIFFGIEALLVSFGLRTVKTAEAFILMFLFAVILGLTLVSVEHVQVINWQHLDWTQIFFPFGVLLFAFHGATSVPEAHSLLLNKEKTFKRAIISANLITIFIYILFTLVVVGVTGLATTEIATIGLGKVMGETIFLLGSLFAVIAMGGGFLMAGVALRDSMRWDFNWPDWGATAVVCLVPLAIFSLGLRHFVEAIGLIGGVLMSMEMILILAIYWRTKSRNNVAVRRFGLINMIPLVWVLLFAFSVAMVYSVGRLF